MSAFEGLDRPLNSAETQRAIEAILARVEQIHGLCGEGFPLYNDGAWKVSAGGSWLGGFWAGWWWLRAVHYGRQADRQQALRIAERLRDKLGPGFMERLITVVVTYRETSISELLTDTVSAYIKKIDKGSQSGADPVKDKFELHVNSVLYNGLSPVAEEG